jgi:site-specific DNA-methyltransferase (adenine-specific)
VAIFLRGEALEKKMTAYMPKSKNDKWGTPKHVYDKLNEEFTFNFDPCPITWKEGDADGLSVEWGTSTFCNPPYSATAKWIEKASNESKKGKVIVMLINAVTDTKAFHKYIYITRTRYASYKDD